MASKIRRIENDTELDRLFNSVFVSDEAIDHVEVGDEKVCLPIAYERYEESIRRFEVRDDDVFLVAHPKTGSTWLQETLWLIVNNLDYEGAKQKLYDRSPLLELAAIFDVKKGFGIDIDLFAAMEQAKSPRLIKSHLHWSLLPEQIRNGSKQPKIITVLRNAEDTCVSYYHHSKRLSNYNGTFEDFCKLFIGGRVCFGPFWSQVLSCWQQRDKSNILILRYKDMKENMPCVLRKIAAFLGKTMTDEQVEKLAKHLSFDAMKKNSAVNVKEEIQQLKGVGLIKEDGEFIRSGKVGHYKDVMSPDLIEEFKSWTEQSLRGTGLVVE